MLVISIIYFHVLVALSSSMLLQLCSLVKHPALLQRNGVVGYRFGRLDPTLSRRAGVPKYSAFIVSFFCMVTQNAV